MKTNTLFTIVTILLCSISFSQTTAVPDENFEKALIKAGHDSGEPDGKIDNAVAEKVLYLDIQHKSIKDLSGIEAFKNLQRLNAYGNEITTLDLSFTNSLTSLKVNKNKLEKIDVSGQPNLKDFDCSDNKITEVDLSNNEKLTNISCYNLDIPNFKLGNYPDLESINLNNTGISSLDLSNYPKLKSINATNNKLTTIDLSKNVNLQYVLLSNNSLTELNLSMAPYLSSVQVQNNPFKKIDLRNGANSKIRTVNATECPNLKSILVDNPENTSLKTWKKGENVKFKAK